MDHAAIISVVALALAGLACAARPTDVAPARALHVSSAPARTGPPAVPERRVLAEATSDAIAVDEDYVYFGDDATRALYRAPKLGTGTIVVGVPAPLAIATAPSSIVWIGKPGNVVLRAPRDGGQATVVRDRGAFTALATLDGDVFVGEATPPAGGTLTRVSGPTATRLAVLDAAPRAIVADGADLWVQTPHAVARVSPSSGRVQDVVRTDGLSRLAVDADAIYTTEPDDVSRALVRVTKSGGSRLVIARGVRDGPIAVEDGWVYYLEENGQPRLRRAASNDGATAFVARDDALRHVLAMAVDRSGIYFASEGQLRSEIIELPVIVLDTTVRGRR